MAPRRYTSQTRLFVERWTKTFGCGGPVTLPEFCAFAEVDNTTRFLIKEGSNNDSLARAAFVDTKNGKVVHIRNDFYFAKVPTKSITMQDMHRATLTSASRRLIKAYVLKCLHILVSRSAPSMETLAFTRVRLTACLLESFQPSYRTLACVYRICASANFRCNVRLQNYSSLE